MNTDSYFSLPPAVIFCGPTGTGKSARAIEFAQQHNGEIVNIDVAQIYEPLRIGVARPSAEECSVVPHHLYGVKKEPLSVNVFSFNAEVEKICLQIHLRGKLPIIVGGNHFYIFHLFFPLSPNYSTTYSSTYPSTGHSTPASSSSDHSISGHSTPGHSISDKSISDHSISDKSISDHSIFDHSVLAPLVFSPKFSYSIVNHDYSFRERYQRSIEKRVTLFFKEGWYDEVKNLSPEWITFATKKKFIGYREVHLSLLNQLSHSSDYSISDYSTSDYSTSDYSTSDDSTSPLPTAHSSSAHSSPAHSTIIRTSIIRSEIGQSEINQSIVRATLSYAKRQRTFVRRIFRVLSSRFSFVPISTVTVDGGAAI